MTNLDAILQPVRDDFERCQHKLDSLLQSDNSLLDAILKQLAQHKGKMLRPLIALLSAKLLGRVGQKTRTIAVCFEILHTATLLHDDVVDESDQRRGTPSVNAAFSNKIAVLVGDYLLATSLQQAASLGDTKLIENLAHVTAVLSNGELQQQRSVFNQDISEEIYFDIIRAKTAELFSAAAASGAQSVGASEEDQQILRQFAECLGICFQIKDDIFDYISTEETLGKPVGNDLREGKITLPAIHALLTAQDESKFQLAYKVKEGSISPDEMADFIDFTLQNGGIDYAQGVMEEYAERARRLLIPFPMNDAKAALLQLVDYVIDRNH